MTKPLPTWCPGCGAFTVSFALQKALKNLKIAGKDTVVCFDIGCSGNMSNVLDVCVLETLHGRSIPVACGVKSAKKNLTVIAQAGDGGLLDEGLNHFIHAIKRNDPVTLIVNNNQVFGLTAGQQSSGTPQGMQARSAKNEKKMTPLSVVDLAAVSGATFIARVPESEPKMMVEVFEEALKHKGFAVVEILQPCKIWAKNFPKPALKKIAKPVKNAPDLIGKSDLAGLLFSEERVDG